jgi:integrase
MAKVKVKFTAEIVLGFPVPPKGRARAWDTVTNGLMLQVTPKGARSFYAYYRLGREPDRKFIGDATVMSLRDARKETEDYREMARRGDNPKGTRKASSTQDGTVKMITVFEVYLKDCTEVRANHPPGHKKYLAPNTLANLTSTIRGLIREFGHVAWNEVTPAVLLRWHKAQEMTTKARANTYVERFRDVWRWARHPANSILPPEAPSAEVLLEDYERHSLGKRTRRMSDAEITLMWEALDHFREVRDHRVTVHALDYVEMLLRLGCRKVQLAQLRWVDDSEGNYVEFRNKVPFRLVFRRHKTSRKGTVYMEFESDVAEALLRIKQNMITGNPFVFPSTKDPEARTHIVDVRGLLKLLTDHADIAELMPHDFRRTGASVGTRAGLTRDDVRKNLHHEDVRTTEDYMNLDEAAQAEAAANRSNFAKATRYIASLRKSA